MKSQLKIQYGQLKDVPPIVKTFSYSNNAWIVGSAAFYLAGIKESLPRDWDVLIPFANWSEASRSIPRGTPTNSFGGVKIKADGVEVDVWPDDIARFLINVPPDMKTSTYFGGDGYGILCIHLASYTILESSYGMEKHYYEDFGGGKGS